MPYQRLERPEPMAVPMETELEEETKVPTVAEARARFDTTDSVPPKKVSKMEFKPVGPPKVPAQVQPKPVPEFIPKKKVPPVQKPVPRPEPTPQEQPSRVTKKKKSPSPR
jgi:hypothetical protein